MNKRTIITILAILTLMLTLYRLEVKKRDKNDIDKLYHTSTRSGRPIIYLKDNEGNVELLNSRDSEMIEELEKKFEVVEE